MCWKNSDITSLGNSAAMHMREMAHLTFPVIILQCKYIAVMSTAEVKTVILNKASKATHYEAILSMLK